MLLGNQSCFSTYSLQQPEEHIFVEHDFWIRTQNKRQRLRADDAPLSIISIQEKGSTNLKAVQQIISVTFWAGSLQYISNYIQIMAKSHSNGNTYNKYTLFSIGIYTDFFVYNTRILSMCFINTLTEVSNPMSKTTQLMSIYVF